ncbi:MAG: ATP-binding cassette domain-containing protein, partial [Planctomycetota bacterium]
ESAAIRIWHGVGRDFLLLSAAMPPAEPVSVAAMPVPPESPAPVVDVIDLRKTYTDLQQGEIVAIAGLTFSARPGEVVGLLGPNGAGKTTALRILATLLTPTGGQALVNGFDCVRQPELVRRQIGLVSANTAVYDRMTAREFVQYFGRLHGLDDAELDERIEKLFTQLDMQSLSSTLGSKMSTGMKQKTSIARALIHDPPVLIFDEATNGLDVLAARTLLDTVAQLRDAGKCLIFSTHIMREAERLCDRLVVMHRGRVLTRGGLDELRDRHAEQDLEELFYQLIRGAEHEEAPALG